jgi:hypothetical protein
MQRWTLAVAALLVGTAAPALAHHSVAASYDRAHEVTIEGRVVEYSFVNPHPILTIEVAEPDGETRLWRLEMENRAELADVGFDVHTFRPQDRVIVRGRGARLTARLMYVLQIDRPADGFRYEQVGSRPVVTFGKRD